MTAFNIEDFCGKKDVRWILNDPIPYQGFLYATDGHIAVRVAQIVPMPDMENTNAKLNFGLKLEKLFIEAAARGGMESLPEFALPTMIDCNECGGSGKEKGECEECRGEGFVEWDTDLHSYTADCKECKGDGMVVQSDGDGRTCDRCGGDGKKDDVPVVFGETAISYRYLKMMQRLPGLLVGLRGIKKEEAISFKFDGGEGIVMPIRVRT